MSGDEPDFWNQNGELETLGAGRQWALITVAKQTADGAALCRVSFEENNGRVIWLVEGWRDKRALQGPPSFAYTAGAA